MYIIAGLGNPGSKYENTRHNVGFKVIDELADEYGINVNNAKYKSLIGQGIIEGQKVLLVKPQTFMNLSGEAVRAVMDFYKIDPDNELIVVCDEIYLPCGGIRIRKKGSAGGHNGLKNIILHTQTEGFSRVKIGVGEKPEKMDLADHVLGHFPKEDEDTMKDVYKRAAKAVALMISGDVDRAMNLYNTKK